MSGIPCHRFEINRRRSRPITVDDLQLEAKLRPVELNLPSVPLSFKLMIFCLSSGPVKENIGGQRPSAIPPRLACNAEARVAEEKVSCASLSSKRASLLGKFQCFEADTNSA